MKQNKKQACSELGRLKIEKHNNKILSVANKKAASFKSSFYNKKTP